MTELVIVLDLPFRIALTSLRRTWYRESPWLLHDYQSIRFLWPRVLYEEYCSAEKRAIRMRQSSHHEVSLSKLSLYTDITIELSNLHT